MVFDILEIELNLGKLKPKDFSLLPKKSIKKPIVKQLRAQTKNP